MELAEIALVVVALINASSSWYFARRATVAEHEYGRLAAAYEKLRSERLDASES